MFGLLSYLYAHSQSPNHRYPRGSPEAIKANSPLANGYFACIFALQGDLDYNSKTLLLPRSTSHNACSLCKATIHGALSWKNCQLQAPWIASQWTPEAWRQWPGKSACKIFDLSYLTACNVALDYMHTKYLGSDRYQIGSLFYYLVFDVLNLTPKANLAVLWQWIKQCYKRKNTRVRYGAITKLTMFKRKNNIPQMRGKAGEIKHIIPVVAEMWNHFMEPDNAIHKQIKLMLQLNAKMEKILDMYKGCFALPSDDAQKFTKYAFGMAQVQSQLASHFLQNHSQQLFKSTAKIHMVLHSALLSHIVSPSLVWNFRGEDMMRRIQKLGESAVRGNRGFQASMKMVDHYRIAMHHLFETHK